MLPAIALGQEPPDGEAMRRPPRGLHGRLLSARLIARSYGFLGVMQAAWAMTMFFVALRQGGWRFGEALGEESALYRGATGLTLVSVIFVQVANLASRRFERRSGLDAGLVRNRLLAVGVVLELAFAYAVLWVPSVGRVIGTGPVDPKLVALAGAGAPLFLLADWLRKRLSA